MAKHVLEICKTNTLEVVGNSLNTYYATSEEKLIIVWKGESKTFNEFTIGDVVIVDCWGGFPKVYKFQYPKNIYKFLKMFLGGNIELSDIKHFITVHYYKICEYQKCNPDSQGLYFNSYADNNTNPSIKFVYYYQAEGITDKVLYIDPKISMKDFKKFCSTLNRQIGKIHGFVEQEENFTQNVTDKGTFGECLKKYSWCNDRIYFI